MAGPRSGRSSSSAASEANLGASQTHEVEASTSGGGAGPFLAVIVSTPNRGCGTRVLTVTWHLSHIVRPKVERTVCRDWESSRHDGYVSSGWSRRWIDREEDRLFDGERRSSAYGDRRGGGRQWYTCGSVPGRRVKVVRRSVAGSSRWWRGPGRERARRRWPFRWLGRSRTGGRGGFAWSGCRRSPWHPSRSRADPGD